MVMIATLLQALCLILLLALTVAAGYDLFLAAVAALPRPPSPDRGDEEDRGRHFFAILIPAHNEEKILGAALESCAAQEYPQDRRRVYVVADNCSDRTQEVAEAQGATCLVREDPGKTGKGFALAWALPRILREAPDAVVILDADCRLDPEALRIFDRHLAGGARVLQAAYTADNPDESSLSYAVAVGNFLENRFFYLPKSRLGWTIFLQGTGMVLDRRILEVHPWRAYGLVEDVEYSLELIRAGTPITFLEGVRVWSSFPASPRQITVQRERWAGGNFGLQKRRTLGLFWEGLRRGRPACLDAALTLWVLSRPQILLGLLLALGSAGFCLWASPGLPSQCLLAWALSLLAAQGLYLAAGVLAFGLSARRLRLLAGAPLVLVRLMALLLSGARRQGHAQWRRTPRP